MLAYLGRDPSYAKNYERKLFKFSDGGQIHLDFYPKRGPVDNEDVIIFFPGLVSLSTDHYISHAVEVLHEVTGKRIAILNKRGLGNLEITGTCPFSWSRLEDYDEIIEYLKKDEKAGDIYAFGMSLGANVIQHYLGKRGDKC